MAQDSTCRECSLSVDQGEELYTICDGYCARFFHAKCAGLSETEMDVLKSNIIWMCDECLDKFLIARSRRSSKDDTIAEQIVNTEACKTPIEKEIQDLKDSIAAIRNTVSTLLPTTSTNTIEPAFLHSTPVAAVAAFELYDGTSMCSDSIGEADQASPQKCEMETIEPNNFSLLLTNIDASVSVSEIHRMVVAALRTQAPDHIEIVKLVPNWKRRESVDFVSFKVVLDGRWRSKAMDPSTWPKGVKFREFINRRINTWKPV